jgi:hypothetical protein
MGQARKRIGRDGRTKYTAYYNDLGGYRRSAGTFTSLREANRAWQLAAARVSEGRGQNLQRGRQLFRPYVEETWFPPSDTAWA